MTNHPSASIRPIEPRAAGWRRALRWLLWCVGGFVALLLCVALAWVASNLSDAEPAPLPPELAPPAPRAADQDNAAYALMGLHAAADRDPVAAGRAEWQARANFWALPAAQRALPAQVAASQEAHERSHGKWLAGFAGPPVMCDFQGSDCSAAWIAQAAALARQREASTILGRRCERLLDGPFAFEELWPAMHSLGEPVATHISPALFCSTWFRSGALLAWAQGRRDETLSQMGRADKLQRGLLAGSHSLIAQMIALRVSRYTFETVTALAVRDATLAAALAPMLAPLPDQAVAAKRWMVFESARGRAALAGIFEQCLATPDPAVAQGEQVLPSSVFAIDGWLCRHRIGLHPHRTEQQIDQSWLAMMRSLDAGWPALLAQSAERARTLDARPAWQGVRWRNTFGATMVEVTAPAYRDYLARHADLELHREAAALAVGAQAQRIPAPERAAWAQRQPMSDTLRQRLSWQDDGRALEAKTWRDATSGAGFDVKRDGIRVAWPG